jgi:hypothetical protein
MQDLVWITVIDHRYLVAVTRTGTYRGELAVSDGLDTVYRRPIDLMFNALLGPSSAETAYWLQCALDWIDSGSSPAPSSHTSTSPKSA